MSTHAPHQSRKSRSSGGSRTRAERRSKPREPGSRVARRLAALRRWLRWPRISSLLRRLLATVLGAAAMAWAAGPVYAQVAPGVLPAGGVVVSGQGLLQASPGTLTVHQSSARLGIDWQSFSIGRDALVEFLQPGPGAIALNRVVGHDASQIYGRLRANGQVFLTNPNGVLFAPGAKVDVGGLVASTLDLTQADFAAGRDLFRATGAGASVVNEGEISARAGGYLALFGQTVDNRGDLRVDAGSVVLASGRAATVSISGAGLISAVIDPGVAGAVLNSGRIAADGGSVRLDATAADALASSLVNNSGIVRANALEERNGQIWITGDRVVHSGVLQADGRGGTDAGRITVKGGMEQGSLHMSGSVSARAEGGRGGQVETSAAKVEIAPEVRVDSRSASGSHGTWLIDPTDFTVSEGSAPSTSTGIGSVTLSANLELGNVSLLTATAGAGNGDLFVNGAVSWDARTKLTLTAARHVEVNRNITATGDGTLEIATGPGGNFTLGSSPTHARISLPGIGAFILNGVTYTKIRTADELQSIALNGNYILAGDVDVSVVTNFNPIGNEASATFSAANSFTGRFDGLGNRLTGVLAIDNTSAQNVGLFASLSGATVRNLAIDLPNVRGGFRAGALAGSANGATVIENVRVGSGSSTTLGAGRVQSITTAGPAHAGGVIGTVASSTTVTLRRVEVGLGDAAGLSVSASGGTSAAYAGGVAGLLSSGRVETANLRVGDVQATGSNGRAGGAVGEATASLVGISATGAVNATNSAGGIVGNWTAPSGGEFRANQSAVQVSSAGHAGGLIGVASGSGSISDSDATGNVSSTGPEAVGWYVGGAVGHYILSGAPVDITAAGNVSGGNSTGGLIGYLQSNVALTSGSLVSIVPSGTTKTVTGPRWVGGLIGYSDATSAASGLNFNGSVTATGGVGAVGGLYGRSNSALSNSSTGGSVSGGGTTGGLVGQANGSGGFADVSSSATVTSTGTATSLAAGGLVGDYNNNGAIIRATATGAVSGQGTIGGLIGDASSPGSFGISDSSATGNVTHTGSSASGSDSGGLVGTYNMPGAMVRVNASGIVSGGQQAGGLVGSFNSGGNLEDAFQTGATVSGSTYVGGLVGFSNAGAMTRVTAVANVSSNATGTIYLGGLVGRSAGSITGVAGVTTATGSVSATADTGTAYVGGLVGYAQSSGRTFTAVSTTGNVSIASTSDAGASGGLVGWASHGSISASTATGSVSGGRYAGGIVGYFNPSTGSLSNLTASGNVSSRGDAGGLVGFAQATGSLTNSTASGTVSSSNTTSFGSVGGAVGYTDMSGGISNVTAAGSVSGGIYTGGVVGYHNTSGTLASVSTSTSSVSGGIWVGGIAGISRASSVTGLSAAVNVVQTSTSGGAGGLMGYHEGAISNSSASGTVTSNHHAGGLIGQLSGSGLKDTLSATGPVTSTTTSTSAGVGGLIGYVNASGNLNNLSASGAVNGGGYTGGLIGFFSANASATLLRATGNVTQTLNGQIGGLIGYADGTGSISDARASGTVLTTTSAAYAGGLMGYFGKPGGLTDAHATGNVTGSIRSGGLVGYYANGGTLDGASATGNVVGETYVGGLVGDFVSSGNLNNATASGSVSGTNAGGLVGSFFSSGNALNVVAGGAVTATSRAGGLFGLWQSSGNLTDSRATGTVYGDYSAGGLVGYAWFNGSINNSSASGAVGASVIAGGLVGEATNINISRGSATGRVVVAGRSSSTGHAGGLVGQYFTNGTGGGIFDSVSSGTVLLDMPFGYAGGLVGQHNGGSLERSSASGNVTSTDSASSTGGFNRAGGLAGSFTLNTGYSFTGNTAAGAVVSNGNAGGLVGDAQSGSAGGALVNSSASGSVTGRGDVGGLVGQMLYMGIVNGTATGRVRNSDTSGNTGGLVGEQYALYAGSSILDSRASGDVSGGFYAGGLVGLRTGGVSSTMGATGISDSSASGRVSDARYAGGLVGRYDGNFGGSSDSSIDTGIRRSLASGDVSGSQYAGGLVAWFSGYGGFASGSTAAGGISDSRATGDVTLRYANEGIGAAGGLVGLHDAQTRTSTLGTQLGGIQRSTASGNVTLSSTVTIGSSRDIHGGGLVGQMDGPTASSVTVSDSYATGAVSLVETGGRMRAGGLIGSTDSSVARVYATGAVEATGVVASRRVGGLVGNQSASSGFTSSASYWATDSTGQATSPMGSASTLTALRTASTFDGWSLASAGGSSAVWRIYEGFTTPLLRGQLRPLTVSVADVSKAYDGTTNLGSVPITIGGTSVLEPQNIFVGGTAADVGSYTFGAGNLYSNQQGYDLTVTGSATLTITGRVLTLSGVVADKVYDGNTSATLASTPTLGGLVDGEDLVFVPGAGFAANFATRNAGVDKTVNISGSYSIADGSTGKASNYVLPAGLSTTADILPLAVSIGGLSAVSRPYDGSTTVQVSASGSVVGVLPGDSVSFDPASVTTGTIPDKNVGLRPVTVAGALLGGADAGNYRVTGADTLNVSITPRPLVLNGITADDRAYNRSTTVSLRTAAALLTGVVAGDNVVPVLDALRGAMADKHVGDGKPVTVTGTAVRGLDAVNYTVTPGPVTVNITPYLLTVGLSHTGSSSRVYDGTTNASVSFPISWWFGDDITVNSTGIGFADKNVAYTSGGAVTTKPITATGLTLSGADASNYSLQNTTATINGTITPKPLTVSGVSAVNRVYDGTRDVTVNITGATVDTSAVIPGDVVAVSTPGGGTVVGQVANKNAGTAKPVTVPGLALTGTDALNYSITGSGSGVTVDIARKPVTANYRALSREYNGNVFAGVDVTTTDFVSGDSANFYIDDSNCGALSCGYAVFVTPGSTLTSYTTSRHAGTELPVLVVSDNFIFGTDAANYTLSNPRGSAGTATISPRPVTLSFNGVTKVYDGSTTASVSLVRSGASVYSIDAVSTTQTAVYTGAGAKNVGTGKPIAISDIVLSGPDAGNYIVSNTTATTTGNVTAKPITVSGITATDRQYDGTTTVSVTAGTVGSAGFVPGDVVSVSLPPGGLTTGTIATAGAGLDKPVTVTGLALSGADAPNYLIDSGASGILVDILQKSLTPSYIAPDKVYDGGITATVTSNTSGIVGSDVVTFTQTARFVGDGAKNVGTGKTIEVSGIRLGGAAAANYTLDSTTASTTGRIVPKPVTATYVGGTRVYNGLADVTAPVVGNSTQFVLGDIVGFSQTAVFTGNGGVGEGKAVSISGVTLTGPDAFNYSLSGSPSSTTATVTPRPLSVTGVTATGRVYDGTTTVAVNVSGATVDTSAVIPGDRVSIALPPDGISTGTMSDRFVGSSKPVTISGASLTGAESSNYVLVGASGLTVNITPRALTAAYSALDKVYDGSANASIGATPTDLLAVDAGGVGISADGVFSAGKNVGTDKTVAISGGFLTGGLAGNYTLANPNGTATASITPRTLSLSFSGISKVYDGLTSVTVAATLGGRVSGDVVSTTQTAEFTGTGAKNVGSGKPVSISGIALTGTDAGNYRIASDSASSSGSITPRPITVSGLDSVIAVDRVYNGSTTVDVIVPTGVTLTPVSSDIVSGDVVTIAAPGSGLTTGTMSDRHVGAGKPVAITGLSLSGADAGNYFIAGTAGVNVDITPLSLTAIWAGVNRVYDGSVVAQASGSSASVFGGDSVLIRATGVFTDGKNVGTAKPISITGGSLSGTDARNYTLANPTGSASADVTRRFVTPGYETVDKVYDGTTNAPVVASITGFVSGDDIRWVQDAQFTGPGAKNVGTGKPVSVTDIRLQGTDAGNYHFSASSATTTGRITPRPITLTGLTGVSAVDRVYNGSTAVDVRLSGTGPITVDPAAVIPGDVVSVSPIVGDITTGSMADKHVGTAKPVVVDGLALTGVDAPNYRVAATEGVTINITPRPLTASYAGVNKVYDGTATASVLGTSADLLLGDSVLIGGSAVFAAGKNAGTGLVVNVTAGLLSGTDSRNYLLSNPTGTATADITPKSVTAIYAGGSRVYDGSVLAPVTGELSGLIGGDSVSLSQAAVFTGPGAKNAGVGKAVTVSGINLAGTDASNYLLTGTSASTTATVTPRPLRIIGLTGVTATDRVYDGSREVAVTVTSSGPITPEPGDLIAGDVVTLTAPPAGSTTGLMADRHVGTNKPVAVTGLTIGGADALNYSVAETAGVTVNITPKPLTAVFIGTSRVYDGTVAASVTGSSADILGGDSVLITGSGEFTGVGARNAGLNKPISISSAALGGLDGRNYLLTTTTGSAVADITPRPLVPTYTGVDREYDGTTSVSVTRSLGGLILGDSVTVSESASFTDGRNVGTAKPVRVTGISLSGTDAANYRVDSGVATTTASVTPRLLNITGLSGITATNRVYDGTLNVDVSVSGGGGSAGADNIVPGDDVSVSIPGGGLGSGRMLDKHAGTAKPVTLSGLVLGGADAGNYLVGGIAGLTVNIAPREVSLSGVLAVDRVYDGTSNVFVDSSGAIIAGALPGDLLSVSASGIGTMADRHVGSAKLVSVAGLGLAGVDARNYVVAGSTPIRVNITPRDLNVLLSGVDRIYDGSTTASVVVRPADLLAGDSVSLAGSAEFSGPGAANAGTGKTVSVSGLSLSGTDAANYRLLGSTGSTTASILPRVVTVTSDFALAFEDELTGLRFGASVSGLLPGLGHSVTGLVPPSPDLSRAVGGSLITLLHSGGTVTGTDAGNYELRYEAGRLLVLPRPVRLGDETPRGDGGFGIDSFTPQELAAAALALDETVRMLNAPVVDDGTAGSGLRAPGAPGALTAAELLALFGNDSRQITLPSLRRLPLINIDPALRRLLGAAVSP